MNRHFQVKRVKYSKFHIKTTAWITTKFLTLVQSE